MFAELTAVTAAGPTGDGSSALVIILAAILGGGLLTGIAQLIKARSDAKRVNLDTDPNSPRVAIGGAETAVTLLQRALDGVSKENGRLLERVEHLETVVDERDQQLDDAKRKMSELERTTAELRRDLDRITRLRDRPAT